MIHPNFPVLIIMAIFLYSSDSLQETCGERHTMCESNSLLYNKFICYFDFIWEAPIQY